MTGITAAVSNCGVMDWLRDTTHWAHPDDFYKRDPGPATRYVYIPNIKPYFNNDKQIPIDFNHLMAATAPKPLLIMNCEYEMKQFKVADKV